MSPSRIGLFESPLSHYFSIKFSLFVPSAFTFSPHATLLFHHPPLPPPPPPPMSPFMNDP